MYGAILGDIIGSPYEFDRGEKIKTYPLFSPESNFTDDSVMTLAVAKAFMQVTLDADDDFVLKTLEDVLHEVGLRHPHAGYGGMSLPENIQAYSIAVRGIRHTYRRMAGSVNR